MLGAIIGDTVGSVFEFNNIKTKNFSLINKYSSLTDDSIMTLAVADIIQNNLTGNRLDIVKTLKKWGRAYPDVGYGGYFYRWLFTDDVKSYNSYGNGAAMRVSACGWYGRDEEEVKQLSKAVTEVTHSHPEGIKGAEVTAMCVYYARTGKSKEFIKKYAEQYYSLDFDYEELRKTYYHGEEICQNTVPQAIFCFLISDSFEDCLRTTISIGGDCDTTAAISCAIAEAYYKYIDEDLIKAVLGRVPEEVNGCNAMNIINKFIEYKTIENVISEEINEETVFLCHMYERNGEKFIDWCYSKKEQALIDYLNFAGNLCEKSAEYLKLSDKSTFEVLINQKNEYNKKNNIKEEYRIFRDLQSAVLYMKNDLNISSLDLKDLFNQVYSVN